MCSDFKISQYFILSRDPFLFFHQLTKSNSELEILDTVRIQNERNVISFYLIILGIQIVITKFCKKIENSQLEKM